MASDGRWYPPHLHPSRAPQAPPVAPTPPPPAVPAWPADGPPVAIGAGAAPRFVVPPVVPDLAPGYAPADDAGARAAPPAPPRPLMQATGIPVATSGPASSPWETEAPWAKGDTMTVGGHHPGRPAGRLRATVDPRGAFVAIGGLLLVAACFLPYYKVSGPGGSASVSYTVIAHQFGAWRVAILAVAVLCVLVGLLNSALRVGVTGAVAVFITMRLLAVAQLGLWVAALLDKQSHGVIPAVAPPGSYTTKLTWVAIAAVAISVIALAGSLASLGRR